MRARACTLLPFWAGCTLFRVNETRFFASIAPVFGGRVPFPSMPASTEEKMRLPMPFFGGLSR